MYRSISSWRPERLSHAAFLACHPPFDALPPAELAAAAATVAERSYPAGEAVLVEDGAPATGLSVVRTGAMELVHGDQVVDLLEPGQCFGHPSLLSGLAPAFTVRAHEDATVLWVPATAALRVLAQPAGVAYVARSLRRRLVRTGQTVHALPELSTRRIGSLVGRAPLRLPAGASAREAAEAMTRAGTGAALLEAGGGLRVVTDADLRERVLAAGRSPDAPVDIAGSRPPVCVEADRTAGEALMDLLDADRRELCVTERGRVVGLLSIEDVTGGEHTPFALRRAIARAPGVDALVWTVAEGLPPLLGSLLASGLGPGDITRVLAIQSDTATTRLLDFALARHGPAPASWAWLALGSVARLEVTLASDQDNALAYADPGGEAVDAYFARVAADVNGGLARCGLGPDRSGVLARNPAWRMPAGRWRAVFRECLEQPDSSHLVRAAVSFDFRAVVGGLDVAPPLVEVLRAAQRYPDFLRRLARTATDRRVPLHRLGSIHPDRDGSVDLKAGGAVPIANLARFYALAAGVTISPTLDRLVGAEETGHLNAETATALREAFAVIARLRLEHHATCLREGRPPDNRVEPGTLAPLRRVGLREALRAVAAAQKKLNVYVPLNV